MLVLGEGISIAFRIHGPSGYTEVHADSVANVLLSHLVKTIDLKSTSPFPSDIIYCFK